MTEVSGSSENSVPAVHEGQAPYVVPDAGADATLESPMPAVGHTAALDGIFGSTSEPIPAYNEISNSSVPFPTSQPATVEWDHSGRVISAKFSTGHVSRFKYDQNGNLYAFSYAKLAWSTVDGANWAARDQHNDWTMAGRVDINLDGSIRLSRGSVTRILKLNGMIVDELPDGSVVETMRQTAEATPFDLMATSHPRAAVREPQTVMEVDTAAAAGAPPSGRVSGDSVPEETSRRVVAGGRRMSRLRAVEEKVAVAPVPTPGLVEETKTAFEDFVAQSAVYLLEKTKGVDAPELPSFLDKLAAACHRQRRVDEARVLHERSLAIRAKHLGGDHSDTGINYHGLGRIYLEWGRYTEAEQYLLNAVKVFDKGLRKAKFMLATDTVTASFVTGALNHVVSSLHTLASLYHEQNKLHLCKQLHESAVSAVNAVDPDLRTGIDAPMESLAAMAVLADGTRFSR